MPHRMPGCDCTCRKLQGQLTRPVDHNVGVEHHAALKATLLEQGARAFAKTYESQPGNINDTIRGRMNGGPVSNWFVLYLTCNCLKIAGFMCSSRYSTTRTNFEMDLSLSLRTK